MAAGTRGPRRGGQGAAAHLGVRAEEGAELVCARKPAPERGLGWAERRRLEGGGVSWWGRGCG